VKLCNAYDGSWGGLGCEMSTYHLKDAITDIVPLKVADVAISDASIRNKLTAIGYGTQNEPVLGTHKARNVMVLVPRRYQATFQISWNAVAYSAPTAGTHAHFAVAPGDFDRVTHNHHHNNHHKIRDVREDVDRASELGIRGSRRRRHPRPQDIAREA
jgi:hypothetical protein